MHPRDSGHIRPRVHLTYLHLNRHTMKHEPKPIRRSAQIAELSRDHHHALLFVWKLRQGLRNNSSMEHIRSYAAYFYSNFIDPHCKLEEELLLPKMHPQDAFRKQIKAEHRLLALLHSRIADGTPSADDIRAFADAVERHIRFEERIFFPVVERILSPHELNSIGVALTMLHGQEKDQWPTYFWKARA